MRCAEGAVVLYLAFSWSMLIPMTVLVTNAFQSICNAESADWRVVTIFILFIIFIQNVAFTLIFLRERRWLPMVFLPPTPPVHPPVQTIFSAVPPASPAPPPFASQPPDYV